MSTTLLNYVCGLNNEGVVLINDNQYELGYQNFRTALQILKRCAIETELLSDVSSSHDDDDDEFNDADDDVVMKDDDNNQDSRHLYSFYEHTEATIDSQGCEYLVQRHALMLRTLPAKHVNSNALTLYGAVIFFNLALLNHRLLYTKPTKAGSAVNTKRVLAMYNASQKLIVNSSAFSSVSGRTLLMIVLNNQAHIQCHFNQNFSLFRLYAEEAAKVGRSLGQDQTMDCLQSAESVHYLYSNVFMATISPTAVAA